MMNYGPSATRRRANDDFMHDSGDVALSTLRGSGLKLLIQSADQGGPFLSSSAWSDRDLAGSFLSQPTGDGTVLSWRPKPLSLGAGCGHTVKVPGPLIVIANW